MNKIYKQSLRLCFFAFLSLTVLTSCDKFLDELPDNRMELKSTSDIAHLLVNAYPVALPTELLEMYSDNTDEHQSTAWTSFDKFQDQAYAWQDITEIGSNECPQSLWDDNYSAIACANEAIAYIDGLSAEEQTEYTSLLGEALMCRAYAHFTLACIFCQAYDPATASTALGIPYVNAPSTSINNDYTRGTLKDVYEAIDADITRALPLLSNEYEHPKFHFTPSSGNAFATRFYLYYQKYDKAIECANKVLGSDPSGMLRDWASWYQLSVNGQVAPNAYVKSDVKANLLLQVIYSCWGAISGSYLLGDKYSHGSYISDYETIGATGPWGSGRAIGYTIWHNDALSKSFIAKIPYDFEYTDLEAGIGYPHSELPVFNADELLIERAEAKALSGDYNGAVADLNAELKAFACGNMSVTLAGIKSFYKDVNYYTAEKPTVKKEFHTTMVTDQETQEPLLQAVLQLKRILTLDEGLRLQDVKRYGITMYRRRLNTSNEILAVTDTMQAGDPRLAIQLPQDVITAGLEANPRK